jgi:hypothetical protein
MAKIEITGLESGKKYWGTPSLRFFFLVNFMLVCYCRFMRWSDPKIFRSFFPFLFLFIPLFSQAADLQIALVKRVTADNTLPPTNSQRARLIGVDTLEAHESPKLYRVVEKSGRDIKTIKALGRETLRLPSRLYTRKRSG